MILVDTSVWIDHLHQHNADLAACLHRNDVITHPMIVGELALGSLARRQEVLALLGNLPSAARAWIMRATSVEYTDERAASGVVVNPT